MGMLSWVIPGFSGVIAGGWDSIPFRLAKAGGFNFSNMVVAIIVSTVILRGLYAPFFLARIKI
ncbi:hypothetical protein [Erwinia amylovora]|uniref:hypothetical protein n=2 Tax=Erwinia amylovora TaxID=552 RepID=UPI000C068FA5|nr:hypothetical protein [Erwinia amylovora]